MIYIEGYGEIWDNYAEGYENRAVPVNGEISRQDMEYIAATKNDTEEILMIVQDAIRMIYPRYYPQEVVEFFCSLHCRENIEKDIEAGTVGVLQVDGTTVGTGCYQDDHITRVYVKPEFQGRGYGSCIMQCLENEIGAKYDTAYLDASLPASHFYEKRGYQTLRHTFTGINYDGRCFVPQENTENGEVDGNTVFAYHQRDNMVWADYSGGEIVRGHLVGTVAENGELDFYYQHINEQKQVRVGICHSVPRMLENGKIELTEKWQWLNGDKSEGASVIVEK